MEWVHSWLPQGIDTKESFIMIDLRMRRDIGLHHCKQNKLLPGNERTTTLHFLSLFNNFALFRHAKSLSNKKMI